MPDSPRSPSTPVPIAFLTLPVEVRLLIYKHIFYDLVLPLFDDMSRTPSCSLLNTDRRVCQEAAPVIYEYARFYTRWVDLYDFMHRKKPSNTIHSLSQIRNIVVDYGGVDMLFRILDRPSPSYFPSLKHILIEQKVCASATNSQPHSRSCECTTHRLGATLVSHYENAVVRNVAYLIRYRKRVKGERQRKRYEVAVSMVFAEDGNQVCSVILDTEGVTIVEADSSDDRIEEFGNLLGKYWKAKKITALSGSAIQR